MLTWRCALGLHDTAVVCGDTIGLVGCRRCGYAESWWHLVRPERAALEARQREQLKTKRDNIAARMGRPHLVPFQRRVR